MTKIFFFFIILLNFQCAYAQCTGDCENGVGTKKYKNNKKYEGNWKYSKPHGKGTLYFADKRIYAGIWNQGRLDSGSVTYLSGNVYTGEFKNGKKDGKGSMTFKDGRRQNGTFKKGSMIHGTFYYNNGDRYSGECLKGKKHGEGIMCYASGDIRNGLWENDKYIGERPNNVTQLNQETFAVVVGIADYKHFTSGPFGGDLSFTDEDARNFYHFLINPEQEGVPKENIKLLINADASRANILRVLKETFSKAGPEDKVIFYFSGHGAKGEFLPYDTHDLTTIRHDEIKAIFKDCPARTKLCIADACLAGSIKGQKSLPKKIGVDKLKEIYESFCQEELNVAIMLSSRAQEYSKESKSLEQGVFSFYLMKGLKGEADTNNDKIINITELFVFVRDKVRAFTQNTQNPIVFGIFSQKMPVTYIKY